MREKYINLMIISLLTTLLFISFASANIAIGFNNKIGLEPGTTVEKSISIQNSKDARRDAIVEVIIEEGSEYLILLGESTYTVTPGGAVSVPVRISIPPGMDAGTKLESIVLFRDISEGNVDSGGTVDLAYGIRKTIDIEVIEFIDSELPVTTTSTSTLWIWVVVIILIILIVWWLLKRKSSDEVEEE